jgi:hypothetical protein
LFPSVARCCSIGLDKPITFAGGCPLFLGVARWVVSEVVSISLAISIGIGSESVHCALHFHTRFQVGQLKGKRGI